jgi:hypothetical protein
MKSARLDILAFARSFAFLYSVLSIASIYSILTGKDTTSVAPFGLWLGPLHFSLNLTSAGLDRPAPLVGAVVLQFIGWTVTGAITGCLTGAFFHLVGASFIKLNFNDVRKHPFDI